ncbi:hypothetical protein TNCV_5099501 [Trichonephila clavipes]|uniref:Uncharacterized protein n=1 Tax=Trichonephila clavipes TaxID=2585209 RepID=A0A8X6V7E5_TRICX|nr:hypothetical protein TNCV_5099501 [Trichonephila clavipes]
MHPVPSFGNPALASSPERGGGQYYHLALFDKGVFGVSKVRFQILVPHPEKHQERTLHTPRIFRFLFSTPRRNRGLHSAPLNISSVTGKGYYGRPALSRKVRGISNIRFQIPKNDPKCTFSAPRLLGKAPFTVPRNKQSSRINR